MTDIVLCSAIVHAPWDAWRRANVGALRRVLPDARVVQDTDRRGAWPTCLAAWRSADFRRPDATHVLVIMDDALPCPRFPLHLNDVIRARPEHCLTLFSMNNYYARWAAEAGSRWVRHVAPWMQAVVLPVAMRDAWLAWMRDEDARDGFRTAGGYQAFDDERMQKWLHVTGQQTWTPIPNLVQHGGANRALLKRFSAPSRVSNCVLRDPEAQRPIDWLTGIDRAPERAYDYGRFRSDRARWDRGEHPGFELEDR